MKIALLTNDKYLFRKTEFELGEIAEITDTADEDTDVILCDLDSSPRNVKLPIRTINLSRTKRADAVELPYRSGELRAMISDDATSHTLKLSRSKRAAVLNGTVIQLTGHEYALLELLIAGGGELVSREKISNTIWGEVNDRLINLYVHYLREKLEFSGEKIIISSRGQGYGINKKYLGGNS